jgi:hypothetical protein
LSSVFFKKNKSFSFVKRMEKRLISGFRQPLSARFSQFVWGQTICLSPQPFEVSV